MKLWIYSLGVLALMTVIVALLLKYTYEPTPEIVMKPSNFAQAQEIGIAVLRRFYSPVAQKQFIAFGIAPQPAWEQEIVRGFILAAAAEKAPFDVVLIEEQMPPLNIGGLPPFDLQTINTNTETQAEFIDRMMGLRKAGKRTLLVTASLYSAHLVAGSPINRFEAATGERFFSISTGPFALKPIQETMVDPPCIGSELDRQGTAPLGCAYLKASRGYYSKQLKATSYIAIMSSPAAEDELLMVAAPGQ